MNIKDKDAIKAGNTGAECVSSGNWLKRNVGNAGSAEGLSAGSTVLGGD